LYVFIARDETDFGVSMTLPVGTQQPPRLSDLCTFSDSCPLGWAGTPVRAFLPRPLVSA
jgi:hypothetical protein